MKKKFRIKKNDEIVDILKKKKTVGDKYFVIYTDSNQLDHLRYAVSVNKKYGNAVERNLIKRRVRDVVYKYSTDITDKDFFIVIKLSAKDLNYQEIENCLVKMFKRAELIKGR